MVVYPLVEIFESLQGEGRNTGRRCVFVRFAGCNLACPWCDTDIRERFRLSLDDLVAEVTSEAISKPSYAYGRDALCRVRGRHGGRPSHGFAIASSYRAKSVILTGGEPTVQAGMDELVDALKARGCWIGVETNGLSSPGWLGRVDYVACSPKFEYAGRYDGGDGVLRRADEVRIVASSEEVVEFAMLMRQRIMATDYYISPCERDGKIDFATAKSVLSQLDGWSLSVQLHKILGFR